MAKRMRRWWGTNFRRLETPANCWRTCSLFTGADCDSRFRFFRELPGRLPKKSWGGKPKRMPDMRLDKFGRETNAKGEVSARILTSGSRSAALTTPSTTNGRKSAAAFLRRFFLSADEHETGVRRRLHASGKGIHCNRSQRRHREDNDDLCDRAAIHRRAQHSHGKNTGRH